jgi:hypothetical protein
MAVFIDEITSGRCQELNKRLAVVTADCVLTDRALQQLKGTQPVSGQYMAFRIATRSASISGLY